MASLRVNVGCGRSPTPGWINFDNSLTVRLSRLPLAWTLARGLGRMDAGREEFLALARSGRVQYADAARRIPVGDGSADALYTCHMLEHLDRAEARRFLAEARRVLAPGGTLRIGVPDIGRYVAKYAEDGDADAFVAGTMLATEKPSSIAARLRALLTGGRHHHWMYDGRSLCALVTSEGFAEAAVVPAGTTRIPDPGGLHLAERVSDTVFVEAVRP